MAFSKKKKRKITVDDKVYYWAATGNDNWISLCIMTEVEGSSRLNCKFKYHHLPINSKIGNREITILANQFVITPYIVRQIIEYALSIGWKPFDKGTELNLGNIDDKIDLRLNKNRAINEKEAWLSFSSQVSKKTDK